MSASAVTSRVTMFASKTVSCLITVCSWAEIATFPEFLITSFSIKQLTGTGDIEEIDTWFGAVPIFLKSENRFPVRSIGGSVKPLVVDEICKLYRILCNCCWTCTGCILNCSCILIEKFPSQNIHTWLFIMFNAESNCLKNIISQWKRYMGEKYNHLSILNSIFFSLAVGLLPLSLHSLSMSVSSISESSAESL